MSAVGIICITVATIAIIAAAAWIVVSVLAHKTAKKTVEDIIKMGIAQLDDDFTKK